MDPLVAARDALEKGKRAVVVTVTGVEGEPPSHPGMAFTLVDDGQTFGTLGCDGFDHAAEADARGALGADHAHPAIYDWDEASRIRVEVRPLAPGDPVADQVAQAELLVVGEGPVARALASLAQTVGFSVRVATRREQLVAGAHTFVVICGHDEEFSQPALRALLASPAPYLGMMGSRRHTGHLLSELRIEGNSEASLRRVHTPVGLDLGAETPEEIALAALAQIVAVRRGRSGGSIA